MKKTLLLMTLLLVWVLPSVAQSPEETIKKTALDYAEGWYEGNAERMERSLHPDLAKRIASKNPDGSYAVKHMGSLELVQLTRQGIGRKSDKRKQQKDITILDVFGNAAVVKLIALDWVDYLQMVRLNGEWKIVNVLWEFK